MRYLGPGIEFLLGSHANDNVAAHWEGPFEAAHRGVFVSLPSLEYVDAPDRVGLASLSDRWDAADVFDGFRASATIGDDPGSADDELRTSAPHRPVRFGLGIGSARELVASAVLLGLGFELAAMNRAAASDSEGQTAGALNESSLAAVEPADVAIAAFGDADSGSAVALPESGERTAAPAASLGTGAEAAAAELATATGADAAAVVAAGATVPAAAPADDATGLLQHSGAGARSDGDIGVHLVGTDSDDILVGTDDSDVLEGGGGNDTLLGGGDDDLLLGNSGSDRLDGGSGDDRLVGGSGSDAIRGGSGNDVLRGGGEQPESAEVFVSGAGGNYWDGIARADRDDDLLDGGTGDDDVDGGEGNDVAIGGTGNDTVKGGSGNDIIVGGSGNGDGTIAVIATLAPAAAVALAGADRSVEGDPDDDNLDGGGGGDIILGERGDDIIVGGSGDDLLLGGAEDDVVDGGDGDDWLFGDEYWDLSWLAARLAPQADATQAPAAETVVIGPVAEAPPAAPAGGVEGAAVLSSSAAGEPAAQPAEPAQADVTAETDAAPVPKAAEPAARPLDAAAADDVASTGDADAPIDDPAETAIVEPGAAAPIATFGATDPALAQAALIELLGADSEPIILMPSPTADTAGAAGDLVVGSRNDDTLVGTHGGNDVIIGGRGNDLIYGGSGDDLLSGGSGNDTFIFRPGFGHDAITDFGDGADQIYLVGMIEDYDALDAAMEQVGADVVITFSATDHITLSNVDKMSLSSHDQFIFV